MVFKQVTWSDADRVFDGNVSLRGLLQQTQGGASPNLRIYAGAASASKDLPLDTFGIIRILFNGANSSFQINEDAAWTGDVGVFDMGGFDLGSLGQRANIQVKEVILRNVDDTDQTEEVIFQYLKSKYGLSPIIPFLMLLLLMAHRRNRKTFNNEITPHI